jgi:branched-subunit amino acid permease
MIDLRMNIWWENIVQLGIPLLIILVPIVVAIILVRKEKLKTQLPND